MIEFHLSDDPYVSHDLGGAEVVVTKYEVGCYDGSGEALALRNGLVEFYNLGHCSCYGPFEGGPLESVSLEEFKTQNESATCSWSDDVAVKFLELVATVAV